MKKLVTFVIDHLRGDGAQKWLSLLAVRLREREWDVMVVGLRETFSEELVTKLKKAGVVITLIGRRSLMSGYGIVKLTQILRARRASPIVTVLFFSDILATLLGLLVGAEYIIRTVRASNVDYSKIHWFLERLVHRLRSGTVYVSQSSERYESVRFGNRKNYKSWVVPNGIDTSHCEVSEDAKLKLREKFRISDKNRVFGVLARLEKQKNLPFILQAFNEIADQNVALLIAGSGSMKEELETYVIRNGLSDSIQIVGYQSDPLQYLSGLDCLISSSLFEGQPNSVLEALSVGCPILISDIPEHKELCSYLGCQDFPGTFSLTSTKELTEFVSNFQKLKKEIATSSSLMSKNLDRLSIVEMVDRWEHILCEREID